MNTRRLIADEPVEQLRDLMGGPLANAHGFDTAAHAVTDTATPTGRMSVEKPENLRLSVALRATEKTPRPAVREPAQHHPNGELNLSKADESVRHFGRDLA
jgi:hypothetical protein